MKPFDLENKNMLIRVTLNGPSGEYANIEANSLLDLKTKGKLLAVYLFFFKTMKINSFFYLKKMLKDLYFISWFQVFIIV